MIGVVGAIYIILFGLSFWQINSLNKKLTDYDQVVMEHELKQSKKQNSLKSWELLINPSN